MNKERRAQIQKASEITLKAFQMLEEAKEIIDLARDDEQEAFDNMPEGLQESERGYAMQEAIDHLDTISSDMDSILGTEFSFEYAGA